MFANEFISLRQWDSTPSDLPEGYSKRSVKELLSGKMSQVLVRHNYALLTNSKGAALTFYEKNTSRKLLQLAGWKSVFFGEHPMHFSKGHFCKMFDLNQKRREEEETKFKQVVMSVERTKSSKVVETEIDSSCSSFSGSFLPDSSRMNYRELLRALSLQNDLPDSKQKLMTHDIVTDSSNKSPVISSDIEKLTTTNNSQPSYNKNDAELSPTFWAISVDPKKRQKYLKTMLIESPFFSFPKPRSRVLSRSSCLMIKDPNTKTPLSTHIQSANIHPLKNRIGNSCHGSSKNIKICQKKSLVLSGKTQIPSFQLRDQMKISSKTQLIKQGYFRASGLQSFPGSN